MENNNVMSYYSIINTTQEMLYCVDSFGAILEIDTYPGLYLPDGQGVNYNGNKFISDMGKLLVLAGYNTSMMGQTFERKVFEHHISLSKNIGPSRFECRELNLVFFRNKADAYVFVQNYGSMGAYNAHTMYGAFLSNSISYSVINCSNKVLFLVDDDDIIEIPCGQDSVTPISGNRPNLNGVTNYIKLQKFKYLGAYAKLNGCIDVAYAEQVFECEFIKPEDFKFIETMNVCLFQDYQEAMRFKSNFGSVSSYRKHLHHKESGEVFDRMREEIKEEVDRKVKNYVIGVTVGLAVNVVGLLTTLVTAIVASKQHQSNNTQTGGSADTGGAAAINCV